MGAKQVDYTMDFTFPDACYVEMLRVILQYEGRSRGLSVGQAAVELVGSAVDLDSYPKEIIDILNEIERGLQAQAIATAFKVNDLDRSA